MRVRKSLRIAITLAAVLSVASAGQAEASTRYNVYRSDAFSTQATPYYCTAAVGQMIYNTAYGTSRHDKAQQSAFYNFGRKHNKYSYGARGLDPQGVAAMLNNFVPAGNWRWVRRNKLQGALKIAAARMEATGLPAVMFVGGGWHVWTMNGFRRSDTGRITKVWFSGPYYPKQTAALGWFDLAPNTGRRVRALAQAFFPYSERYAFGDNRWTPWNGYYVVVVP